MSEVLFHDLKGSGAALLVAFFMQKEKVSLGKAL